MPERCAHPRCGSMISPESFACGDHWAELPEEIQDGILAAQNDDDRRSANRRAFDFWRGLRGELRAPPNAAPRLQLPGKPSETPDQAIVRELCALERGLSDWEVEFVESVTKQVEAGRLLSPGQRNKARQILAWRSPQ